jgi:hypothetical protein
VRVLAQRRFDQLVGNVLRYIANWRLRPVTPVPEPESFALFLVGLGLIGSVVRGRKQNI